VPDWLFPASASAPGRATSAASSSTSSSGIAAAARPHFAAADWLAFQIIYSCVNSTTNAPSHRVPQSPHDLALDNEFAAPNMDIVKRSTQFGAQNTACERFPGVAYLPIGALVEFRGPNSIERLVARPEPETPRKSANSNNFLNRQYGTLEPQESPARHCAKISVIAKELKILALTQFGATPEKRRHPSSGTALNWFRFYYRRD
jgi:hypothetical protein